MKKPTARILTVVLSCLLFSFNAASQFSMNAQLRTRSEFRDGQGAPLSRDSKPAFFISQRTRLNALFNATRIKLGLSLQDVRVWGQDVSTINRFATTDNNGLLLHEAWAEVQLTDTSTKNSTLYLKLGRQELVYDDQRLIGNLDWLQQGRRHDAVVLKYERDKWAFDLAGAYNQNKENSSRTIYNNTPPANYPATTNGGSMYKSFVFLYAKRKVDKGNLSFLFFSDQFNKFRQDSVKTYTEGTWARATTGLYFIKSLSKIDLTASAYYQFGRNGAGQNVRAELLSLAAQYKLRTLSFGLGIDFTSGGTKGNFSKTFDPLYGTPHKFWGLMDYFYAASPFGNAGLVDYYLKSKFKASDRVGLSLDLHHFTSASQVSGLQNETSKRIYGQEADLLITWKITSLVNLECGYSHFFSTDLLTASTVKNVANARRGANWAYIMINIKPEFIFK